MIRCVPPKESPPRGEKWRDCELCGTAYKQYEIDFNSGSVEPAAGETLTGATSGETATVSSVNRTSGSWAGGDATGTIIVTSPSDDFTADENINGSVGGNNLGTVILYIQRKYANRYPESMLIKVDGKYMCREHFSWRYRPKNISDAKVDITERDRGVEF